MQTWLSLAVPALLSLAVRPVPAQKAPAAVRIVAPRRILLPVDKPVLVSVQVRNASDTTIEVAAPLEWPSSFLVLQLRDSTGAAAPVERRGGDYPDALPSHSTLMRQMVRLAPGATWAGRLLIGGGAKAKRGFVFLSPGIYYLNGIISLVAPSGRAWPAYTDTVRVRIG